MRENAPAVLDSKEKPCWELVFVVVKAEKRVNDSWDKIESAPPLAAMLSSYSSIAISRYNTETVALLQGEPGGRRGKRKRPYHLIRIAVK
jgi:hypothetical protein